MIRLRVRLVQGLALMSTGALAGAFGYGAANLVPTFNAVPLDMRLSFHAQLMQMNGVTMHGAMGTSALSRSVAALLAQLYSGAVRVEDDLRPAVVAGVEVLVGAGRL
ncbi:hypothetical protein OG533_30945 [Streptomyces sp. NBC_01186]|uniref:hypothetical protein n=1 Tax=Streptomyces sp. NBC_01186 TaxID=2903765 RepID=UPI002E101D17|nr:hypothetical protein OG533_30945 [Streptomyces sp. NBC_01186]